MRHTRWSGSRNRAPLAGMLLLGVVSMTGCATTPLTSLGSGPVAVPAGMPSDQAKCSVAASQENPLVTEWPASEKANFEARLREGGVVVAYSGCSMRLLPGCRARGAYAWRRTTTTTDVVDIRNADELYAKLPLGAVALEGELERSGRLAVQTTVAGQLELQGFDAAALPADGSCLGATHVVGALSVGSFKLVSGAALKGNLGVDVQVVGKVGGLGTDRESSILREAGDPQACKQSTVDGAHPECGSPIQVFLRALPRAVRDRGAPGTIKVNFVSGEADRTWAVIVGNREVCKTPCDRWIDPAIPYTMSFDAGFWQGRHRTTVPDLRAYGPGPLQVRAYPRANGKFVGGIQMTVWGGMATLAGLALTSVGCAGSSRGMCVGGLITLPIGLALTGPGIYLIVKSAPRAEVTGAAVPDIPSQLAIGGVF